MDESVARLLAAAVDVVKEALSISEASTAPSQLEHRRSRKQSGLITQCGSVSRIERNETASRTGWSKNNLTQYSESRITYMKPRVKGRDSFGISLYTLSQLDIHCCGSPSLAESPRSVCRASISLARTMILLLLMQTSMVGRYLEVESVRGTAIRLATSLDLNVDLPGRPFQVNIQRPKWLCPFILERSIQKMSLQ
ncbi:hypothetical protein BJ742DRAFT_510553 [Cladochytrium replicatum]|nr:hypothetical protein BJ742DRAFT_510553 [Cladochytrium replicatum]